MAHVKTPEERGLVGWWAYRTRDELGLSDVQVVSALPTKYHPATLRKVEGGSAKAGKRMIRELAAFYASEAERRGIDYEPPPRLDEPAALTDMAALVGAISELVAEMRAATQEQRAAMRGIERALQAVATLREGEASGEPTEPRSPAGAPRSRGRQAVSA